MSKIKNLIKAKKAKSHPKKMGRGEYRSKVINPILRKQQREIQGDYPFCEWVDENGLCGHYLTTFAHSRRNKNIEGEGEWLPMDESDPNHKWWFHVAYLCIPHHQKVERLPKEQMFEVISEIIERRR